MTKNLLTYVLNKVGQLILAIQAAGVTRGRNGFHKDKGGEKLAESEEDLLEHRTDGSDAFDTLYIGCEKFPQADTSLVTVDVNGIVQNISFSYS